MLWPRDALMSTHAPSDVVIPLRDRLFPCVFMMLQGAYESIWGNGEQSHSPVFSDLLPMMEIRLSTHPGCPVPQGCTRCTIALFMTMWHRLKQWSL
jgi:hypothetical protein